MPKTFIKVTIAAAMLLALAACGKPSKEDIVEKSRNVSTRAELTKVLGDPDDIQKMGPIENWTYEAENGKVSFIITGDSVALQAATGQ